MLTLDAWMRNYAMPDMQRQADAARLRHGTCTLTFAEWAQRIMDMIDVPRLVATEMVCRALANGSLTVA